MLTGHGAGERFELEERNTLVHEPIKRSATQERFDRTDCTAIPFTGRPAPAEYLGLAHTPYLSVVEL